MTISLKGYNENTATFKISGLVSEGQAVAMAGNLTVKPCASGDKIIGVCVNVRGEYACVQLSGYATLSYTGTAPSVGISAVAADGKGGITSSASGANVLVTDVDETKKTVGFIL